MEKIFLIRGNYLDEINDELSQKNATVKQIVAVESNTNSSNNLLAYVVLEYPNGEKPTKKSVKSCDEEKIDIANFGGFSFY